MLAKNPSLYTGAKRCIALLPRARERLEAALPKLGRLYPDARFPPVTVAIGRGKPVAMGATDTGIQVGLEALCAIAWLNPEDRRSGWSGKTVAVRVNLGARRILTTTTLD